MRARNIKPGFYHNELLASLSPLARILFSGLWCLADSEGRLEDRPKKIKVQILPYDDCDVDALLTDLGRTKFITRYEVDGDRFIQINGFHKHQKPHYKEPKSVIPAPKRGCQSSTDDRPIIEPTSTQTQVNENASCAPDSGLLNVDSGLRIPDDRPTIDQSSEKAKVTVIEPATLPFTPKADPTLYELAAEVAFRAGEGNPRGNEKWRPYVEALLIKRIDLAVIRAEIQRRDRDPSEPPWKFRDRLLSTVAKTESPVSREERHRRMKEQTQRLTTG